MTPEQKAAELQRMMDQAKVLGTLEDHPGWKIVVEMLEAQIDRFKAGLCQLGMDHATTERMRADIMVMQWCRNASLLDRPEQFAEWEAALAQQEEKAKTIKDLGLPPGGR